MEFFLPVIIVAAIALVAGVGLGIANHFMAIKGDEKAEKILAVLPGANCGGCGFSGCKGYAEALVKSANLRTTLCTVGGEAVAAQISEILGVKVSDFRPTSAEVRCRGTEDCTGRRVVYDGIRSCRAAMAFGGDTACRYGCLGYGDCVAACDFDAIRVCNGVAMVDPEKCRACGKCAATCPRKIIALVPKKTRAVVLCSNQDKGAATKAVCSAGCIGCRMCAKACENGAIDFKGGLAVVDYEKCVGCGKCVDACKFHVIRLVAHE